MHTWGGGCLAVAVNLVLLMAYEFRGRTSCVEATCMRWRQPAQAQAPQRAIRGAVGPGPPRSSLRVVCAGSWLEEASTDFRVGSAALNKLRFGVWGCGNSLYGPHFNAVARRVERQLLDLGARRAVALGEWARGRLRTGGHACSGVFPCVSVCVGARTCARVHVCVCADHGAAGRPTRPLSPVCLS